jgi:hypothetical protein
VGLETALAVSALLDVDAFGPAAGAFIPAADAFRPAVDTLRAAVDVLRPAVDAPRIAVPWNNTTYQHTYRAPLRIKIQITIQNDLKVHM